MLVFFQKAKKRELRMQALLEEFRKLPDYRKNKVRYTHPGEMLFLSLLAILSGADGYEDIALWMKERKKELSKLLRRPFVAPAYTTIRNIFLGVDTKAVEAIQQKWSRQLHEKGLDTITIVAADGKTMRGSANKEMNEKARHIVSLFLADRKLTIAQKEVDEKSNEMSALLALLDDLNLEGCVISVDAMHTQKKHS